MKCLVKIFPLLRKIFKTWPKNFVTHLRFSYGAALCCSKPIKNLCCDNVTQHFPPNFRQYSNKKNKKKKTYIYNTCIYLLSYLKISVSVHSKILILPLSNEIFIRSFMIARVTFSSNYVLESFKVSSFRDIMFILVD